jgi:ATP-dependent Clp protease ATP-binding subunit ClpC
VAVAPQVPGPVGNPRRSAQAALDATPAAATVVRRYREAPSPLVRDARGWRTGRLDRVLAGDFDLF